MAEQPSSFGDGLEWKENRDGVGEYIVLSKAVVSRGLVFNGPQDVVAKVQVGTHVKVLEVQVCSEAGRIRGRLKKPRGWISLVNTETECRWAAKMVLCPQRHALQRYCAGREGTCSSCERTFARNAYVLACKACQHNLCMHCLKSLAPLQGWTFQVKAGSGVRDLGFRHTIAPPMLVTVAAVEPGSWAEQVGVHPWDQLAAINGVGVDQVTPQELDNVLTCCRPAEFTFVCSGLDAPEARPPRRPSAELPESVALSVTVPNADFTLLSADTQLFANFKSALRRTVASEIAHGVLREDVELSFSGGPALLVRCVVGHLSEAAAADVHGQLGRSATLGAAVTEALNRLPNIKSIAGGRPVSAVKVELEPRKEDDKTKDSARGHRWQPFRATRTLLKRFQRQPSPSPIQAKEMPKHAIEL